MNSFFKAILFATSNGRLMEYADEWRVFHSYHTMQDKENQNYNRINEDVRL